MLKCNIRKMASTCGKLSAATEFVTGLGQCIIVLQEKGTDCMHGHEWYLCKNHGKNFSHLWRGTFDVYRKNKRNKKIEQIRGSITFSQQVRQCILAPGWIALGREMLD